jgi:hypothetical protein
MLRQRTWWAAAVVIAFPSAASSCAGAETFRSLVARIPAQANVLVLIDVDQTMAAPLAQQQGWSRKLETAYVERPVYLPPEAKKLALGASLRPNDDFLSDWEVAVIELAEPAAMRSIARSESGYLDEIGGAPAAVTPQDAAFLDLGGNVMGVVHPADRQFVARWVAATRSPAGQQLSPYLTSAVGLVNDRVQVLLAIDLTDVLSRRTIETRLADATWLKAAKADLPAVAAVLSKLRGAALRLAIGDTCQGQLQVDFDADVAPLGDAAKPLVLQALSNSGVSTAELADWKVTLAGRSIRMQGELSTNAQRRVFSVIELPSVELDSPPAGGSAAGGATGNATESEARDRSLAYFKSTQVLLDDLRKSLQDTKASTTFMERYARRIDALPVLHVDELLLDYGDKLAETLRIMALSKRQAGIRYGVRANDGGGYYDGYAYGEDAYAQAADRSQAKKEEMSVASDVRVQGWKLIDDATADIRRTLTKKYGVEF